MRAAPMKEFRFDRTDAWREGKWLDLWSVVHFLSGVSMGLVLYMLHFGAHESLVLAFVLLVSYELWEAMVDIQETPTNRIMDVVVGMVSFYPTFAFLAPILTGAAFGEMFAGVLAVNILLAALGWRASRKAAALERRLRARYERGKARAQARLARLRRKMARKRH